MKKSGLADSPLFTKPSKSEQNPPPRPPNSSQHSKKRNRDKSAAKSPVTVQPRQYEAVKPRDHDTTVSRYHETIVETVRKAVKEFGKEAATHRFTLAEKKAIADIIYAYKSLGIKTSENEIARIAVNFILDDYKENGENSLLDRILKALNG